MFRRVNPSLHLIAVLGAVLAGCRHAGMAGPESGSSSFAVVRPPPAPAPGGTVVEAAPTGAQYRDALLTGKPAMPAYPARALAARAGQAQVGVRISIDAEGRVSSVSPSLFALSIIPPGFSDDFIQAVEVAVRQWKFQPARIEYVETVSERGITYERVTKSEKVDTTVDLSFTFTAAGSVVGR